MIYLKIWLIENNVVWFCPLDVKMFYIYEYFFSKLRTKKWCTRSQWNITIRVGTLTIWRGASHMWYMLKDFLGFIHSVSKGNIVGSLWFGYNCQFYTQITQNWENLVISGLFKWHKFIPIPLSNILCLLVQNNQFKLKHHQIIAF